MSAQATRAILLASAIATSLIGLSFSMSVLAQISGAQICFRFGLSSETAPLTSRVRRYRSPIFEIRPSFVLPPVEFCRGARPRKAENSRADANIAGTVTLAACAVAVTGPTPGILARRWLTVLSRCHFNSSWSSRAFWISMWVSLGQETGVRKRR